MFETFYSEEAKQLAEWALEEQNRIKASKIMIIAQKLERQNRLAFGDMHSKWARDMGGYYLKPSVPCSPSTIRRLYK